MRNKIGIPTISRRTFEIIPGIDLPQLIIEDILVSYPLSPSPRKEYVIRAGPWYGSNQQEFTTAHIKDNEIELRFYGYYRMFTQPTVKLSKINQVNQELKIIEDMLI